MTLQLWLDDFVVADNVGLLPNANPQIVGMGSGNFAVAWTEFLPGGTGISPGGDVIARIYDADGALLVDSYELTAPATDRIESSVSLAPSVDGGFLAAFLIENSGLGIGDVFPPERSAVQLRLFNDAGVGQFGPLTRQIAEDLGETTQLRNPQIANNLDLDRYAVTYTVGDPNFPEGAATDDIEAVVRITDGVAGPIDAAQNSADRDSDGDVAVLSNGRFLSVYEEFDPAAPNSPASTSIEGRVITVAGGIAVDFQNITLGPGFEPKVAGLKNGGAVVAWQDSENASDAGAFFRVVAEDLTAETEITSVGLDVVPNPDPGFPFIPGREELRDVASLPDDTFVILYQDTVLDLLIAQQHARAGTPIGDAVVVFEGVTVTADAAPTADGRLLLTWLGGSNDVSVAMLDPRDATIEAADYDDAGPIFASTEVITARRDASTLIGDDDDNTLLGQEGDDRLIGGFGDDVFSGGGGTDTAVLADGGGQPFSAADYDVSGASGVDSNGVALGEANGVIVGPNGTETLSSIEVIEIDNTGSSTFLVLEGMDLGLAEAAAESEDLVLVQSASDPSLFEPVAPTTASAFIEVTPGGGLGASTFSASSFQITNTSTNAAEITSVTFDLSTAILPDMVFDPTGAGGDGTPLCLTPNIGAAATGYVQPDDPCVDPYSAPRNGGFDVAALAFSDFDPGEFFFFNADVDPNSIQGIVGAGDAGAVSGKELVGATVTVSFSDGTSIASTLFEDGSLGGAQTVAAPNAPETPQIEWRVDGVASTDPLDAPAGEAPTVRVRGEAGAFVTLLQMDTRLFIASGDDPFDVSSDELVYYANEAMAGQTLFFGQIGVDGFVDLVVPLLETDGPGDTPNGGLNRFIAVTTDTVYAVDQHTSPTSNVLIGRIVEPVEIVDAVDDAFSTNASMAFDDTVLGNDLFSGDPDVSLVADVSNGALNLNVDGTFTYDPSGAFDDLEDGATAVETFTYSLDVGDQSDSASVTITIEGDVVGDSEIRLALINAATGAVLSQNIASNDTIDIGVVDPGDLTLAAFTPDGNPDGIESIFLNLNNGQATRTENVFPYALFGDNAATDTFFNGAGVPLGDNSLSLELYSGNGRGGDLLDTLIFDFTLVADDDPVLPPPIVNPDVFQVLSTETGSGVDPDGMLEDVDGNVLLNDDVPPGAADKTLAVVGASGDGGPGDTGNLGPDGFSSGSAGGVFRINPDGSVDFDADGDFDDLAPGETRATSLLYAVGYAETGADGPTTIANLVVNVTGAPQDGGGAVDVLNVSTDGEQRGTGAVDTTQNARDNDLEIGRNGQPKDRAGLFFENDGFSRDFTEIKTVELSVTSQRNQSFDGVLEVGLFQGSPDDLSGRGALTDDAFLFKTIDLQQTSFEKGETVDLDVTDLVTGLAPTSDENFLFALASEKGVFRIDPEEVGEGAQLVVTYADDPI